MALEIIEESHVDHGLSEDMIAFILDKYKDKTEFFIETIKVPGGSFDNALYGPSVGDGPISDEDVYYEVRNGRPGESRMIKRPFRKTDDLTVIAGPGEGKECVLYTAFGGPLAPKEPFDSSLDDNGKEESSAFWSVHALADGSSAEVEEAGSEVDSVEEDFLSTSSFKGTAGLLKVANYLEVKYS